MCKYFAAKLSELGCSKEKIHVVASGINIEQFPYKKRVFGLKNKIRLLSVGRLVEKKGIQYGIRAVGELVKLYPNIQYTIVGTGPMENDFKLLIASLKLENHVKLMGGLNHENMKAIYFQSHIFILPCIQAEDNDQEGIPNVLKEAMATGMPVVSTWHSGIPELVEDGVTGLLVAERDVKEIVEKCAQLISNPDLCVKLGENSQAYVRQNFNFRKLTQRLIDAYMFNKLIFMDDENVK